MRSLVALTFTFACCLVGALGTPVRAADSAPDVNFPPITDAERALAEVEGSPEAGAVVLSRVGELDLAGPWWNTGRQSLIVRMRLKILSEKGRDAYGNFALVHDQGSTIHELTGRTVAPDGSVLAIGPDAIFERRISKTLRLQITTVAFPGLEIGSIVDLRYEARTVGRQGLAPIWQFQEEIPTLHSEISYRISPLMRTRPWIRDPLGHGVQTETTKEGSHYRFRAWADDLPALIEEPFGFPSRDLAAQVAVIPMKYGRWEAPGNSWADLCFFVANQGSLPQIEKRQVQRRTKKLLKPLADRSLEEKVAILFATARDKGRPVQQRPETERFKWDPSFSPRRTQILHSMLEVLDLDPVVILAAKRDSGSVDQDFPYLGWFDRSLLRLALDDRELLLDPQNTRRPMGSLAPAFEGTLALACDDGEPSFVELPFTAASANRRSVELSLAVGDDGGMRGQGRLRLSGHEAAKSLAMDDPRSRWSDWLESRFPSLTVAEVTVEQQRDRADAEVRWTVEQSAATVLGDEASLDLSRPFGPARQLFPLPVEERTTPVRLPFAHQDDLQVTIRWPEGWSIETQPDLTTLDTEAGSLSVRVTVDPENRELVYRRIFEIPAARLLRRELYTQLRNLYAALETSDAKPLVLVLDGATGAP